MTFDVSGTETGAETSRFLPFDPITIQIEDTVDVKFSWSRDLS